MKPLPVILALDLEDKTRVLDFIERTKHCISTYKIGPRLFLKEGPSLLQEIKKQAPKSKIFLDFKFYDIPSSTVSAVRSAFEIGANYVTVHASLNLNSLKELYELEKNFNFLSDQKDFENKPFRVLCVTVLSSEAASKDTSAKVLALADKVYQSGLRALVCSAMEAQLLKNKYPDVFLVTPGIRFSGDSAQDQKRVMSAGQALSAGSSALVIGRSLTQCENLDQRLKQMAQELAGNNASS